MKSRRTFLKVVAAAATTPLLLSAEAQEAADEQPDLTFAHLTDVHFGAEFVDDGLEKGVSARGLTETLRHAQGQDIAFIIQGGDWIGEAFSTPEALVQKQWDGLNQVLEAELRVPLYHTVGNHDIWGYDKKSSQTTGREPLWGKAWALQEMGLERPYYSFEHGAWRFIVLDSIRYDEETGYRCELDKVQMAWLKEELAAHPDTPTIIESHAPILSAAAFFDGSNYITGDWQVPRTLMHIDAVHLKGRFNRQPQVKLCLSGHLHLADQVSYNGVYYTCNGAVSGGTWYGKSQETPPGYGLVKLWNDGRVKVDYLTPLA